MNQRTGRTLKTKNLAAIFVAVTCVVLWTLGLAMLAGCEHHLVVQPVVNVPYDPDCPGGVCPPRDEPQRPWWRQYLPPGPAYPPPRLPS